MPRTRTRVLSVITRGFLTRTRNAHAPEIQWRAEFRAERVTKNCHLIGCDGTDGAMFLNRRL